MRLGLSVAVLITSAAAPERSAFDRYPAAVVSSARQSALRIADPLSRRYRSALQEAAAGPANFAGHYVLAQIGCGSGCIRLAAIDRLTGRVLWFPVTVSGWPMTVTEPLTFARNSRLLVVQGMLNEREPSATRQYVFDGRRFQQLPLQP